MHPITEEASFENENLQNNEKRKSMRISTNSFKNRLRTSGDNNSNSENIYSKSNLKSAENNTLKLVCSFEEQIVTKKIPKHSHSKSKTTINDKTSEKIKSDSSRPTKKNSKDQSNKSHKSKQKHRTSLNKIGKSNKNDIDLLKNDSNLMTDSRGFVNNDSKGFFNNDSKATAAFNNDSKVTAVFTNLAALYSDPSELSVTKSKSA